MTLATFLIQQTKSTSDSCASVFDILQFYFDLPRLVLVESICYQPCAT